MHLSRRDNGHRMKPFTAARFPSTTTNRASGRTGGQRGGRTEMSYLLYPLTIVLIGFGTALSFL